jgi:hypothetical protein
LVWRTVPFGVRCGPGPVLGPYAPLVSVAHQCSCERLLWCAAGDGGAHAGLPQFQLPAASPAAGQCGRLWRPRTLMYAILVLHFCDCCCADRAAWSAAAAHLALGMMGEGDMWNPTTGTYELAAKVIADNGLQAIQLTPKVTGPTACVLLLHRNLPVCRCVLDRRAWR